MDSDGGPHSERMFLDILFACLNQAIVDLDPARIFLVGHSGGGTHGEMGASIDERISAFYGVTCSYWWPWPLYAAGCPGNHADWDGDTPHSGDDGNTNQLYTEAQGGHAMYRLALPGFPHRKSVHVWSDGDDGWDATVYHSVIHAGAAYIQNILGTEGTFELWEDTTATRHTVTEWAAGAIVADVVSQLP